MTQFAQYDKITEEVTGFFLQDDPPDIPGEDAARVGYAAIEPPFSSKETPRPSPTARLYYRGDSAVSWEETAPLPDVKRRAMEDIDTISEQMRLLVLGQQTNTKEYERAELHALAYQAAGFSGPVPRGVASWTKARHREGWTDRQAAEDILATAGKWYGLLDEMREARLCAKQDVLHAATSPEVDARVVALKSALVTLLGQMQ